ncbi:MAG: DUF4595 domain-containing protein [Prevotellaceae bacterium]|nr:DUF4595 domain-containing protein [Prevotellaceae bacterium]
MNKNLVRLAMLLAAVTVSFAFASCSDDDDDDENAAESTETESQTEGETEADEDDTDDSGSSTDNSNDANADYQPIADIGIITTDDGEKLLVSSVEMDGSSYLVYSYNDDGLPTSASCYSNKYTMSYDPYSIKRSYFYNFSITFNNLGYVKKITFRSIISSSFQSTETDNFSYDEEGHLTSVSSSCTQTSSDEYGTNSWKYSISSSLTWTDGDLIKVSYSGTNSGTITYSYSSEENKYKQPTMALIYNGLTYTVYNGEELIYTLGFLGYFGVGTAHLPSAYSCNSGSGVFGYSLNDNGTIDTESGFVGTSLHDYTYSYKSLTSGE